MKRKISRAELMLYLWVSLGYLALWILFQFHNYPDNMLIRSINLAWRLIFVVVINFIYFEYILEFVLKKRKYAIINVLLFLATFIPLLLIYSLGAHAWRFIGIQLNVYTELTPTLKWGELAAAGFGFSLGSFIVFGIVRLLYHYTRLKNAAQQLQLEKQQAELSFLKSQTNPHFLFNTLNNIYSLTKFRAHLAPEAVLRLSKILRYMLYETSADLIPVEKELKILNDYIDLEKLRYDDKLRVNFSQDVEDQKQGLPPLLLMPLVENAFKHGVSESRGNRFIDMQLTIQQQQLHFVVKNSSESSSAPGQAVKENIGLSNIRRQLELLYRSYDLSVKQEDGTFTAILNINLSTHVKNPMHHN